MSVLAVPASSRTSFTAGRDLKPGQYVRCIASGDGEVIDAEGYLLATDQVNKKGQRLMVETSTGVGIYATPTSIWSK